MSQRGRLCWGKPLARLVMKDLSIRVCLVRFRQPGFCLSGPSCVLCHCSILSTLCPAESLASKVNRWLVCEAWARDIGVTPETPSVLDQLLEAGSPLQFQLSVESPWFVTRLELLSWRLRNSPKARRRFFHIFVISRCFKSDEAWDIVSHLTVTGRSIKAMK